MSVKNFLDKSFKAMFSAAAFLSEHKNWLLNGEVSTYTKDILTKLENGEITPVIALNEINKSLMHLQLKSPAKTKTTVSTKKKFSNKNYVVCIFDKDNNILSNDEGEDLIKGFDHSLRAHDWAYRNLCDAPNESYAVVSNTIGGVSMNVSQRMAYSQMFKPKTSPFSRKKFPSSSSLGFNAKVKNDVAKFSHG